MRTEISVSRCNLAARSDVGTGTGAKAGEDILGAEPVPDADTGRPALRSVSPDRERDGFDGFYQAWYGRIAAQVPAYLGDRAETEDVNGLAGPAADPRVIGDMVDSQGDAMGASAQALGPRVCAGARWRGPATGVPGVGSPRCHGSSLASTT